MLETIRTAVPADAAAIVRLGRAIDRDQIATDASFRVLLERETPPTTRRLVAETDGRIVAWAPSGVYASGAGWFWVGVEETCRRRGLGDTLYAQIESRLRAAGATLLETTPNDADGRGFLASRGFEVSSVVRHSELDPRSVPPPAPPPHGIRVRSLAESLDHLDALFRLYGEARADVPSSSPRRPWTLAEWRAETVDSPLIDVEASVVVFDDDEPAALAWLYSDRVGQRAETLMAGTRRDRRGRGLATLAKIESSRRAAALGIARILTANDLDNASMLAINHRLGFVESAVVESFVKHLTP